MLHWELELYTKVDESQKKLRFIIFPVEYEILNHPSQIELVQN